MPNLYKTVVEFQPTTGLPEDVVTNTFHLGTVNPASALELTNWHAAVVAFFAEAPSGGGLPLDNYLSAEISRVNHPKVTTYEYDFTAPQVDKRGRQYWLTGSPIKESTYAGVGAAASAGAAPGQVAVCLSYHGDLTGLHESIPGAPAGPEGDTHPKARRRGRLFIGPLNQSAVQAGSAPARPSAGLIGSLTAAADKLEVDSSLVQGAGSGWAVFSPTSGSWVLVEGGWVDNRFDTQRRRLIGATSRTTWA